MFILKNKHPLFHVGILAFPLGIILMAFFSQLYFLGIVGLFILVLVQTPKPTKAKDEDDNNRSTVSLKLVTFVVISFLLGGFIGMLF